MAIYDQDTLEENHVVDVGREHEDFIDDSCISNTSRGSTSEPWVEQRQRDVMEAGEFGRKKRRRYDAGSIHVQSNIEAVRSNAGMYLGDIDSKAALQCAAEILHNCTDEVRECGGGRVRVRVRARPDGRWHVTIADTGRGIPVERHAKTGLSTLETVLTVLHAGGKGHGKSAYGKRTFGVHGVGAAAVCACSLQLDAWTYRKNVWWHIGFAKGEVVHKLTRNEPPEMKWPQGTVISYVLDADILSEEMRLKELQQLCALTRYWDDVTVDYSDPERSAVLEPKQPMDLMKLSLKRRDASIACGPVVVNSHGVRAVIGWTRQPKGEVIASVAGASVPSGTHVKGLERAAVDALRKACRDKAVDGTVGLIAVLDVSVDRPSFSGQNKTALRTGEAGKRVYEACYKPLLAHLKANSEQSNEVLEHATRIGNINSQAEERKQQAREVKEARTNRLSLPLGFRSATKFPPARRELYLLEGRSALGTAINAKMPWQEVLPLRGKLPNLVRRSSLNNNEIVINIQTVLGYDARYPTRPLRVGKIILLTDADVDGDHIEVLLLSIFYRKMKEVLQRNIIYTVDAPLYEAFTSRGKQVTGNDIGEMARTHGKLRNVNRMKGWGGAEVPLLRRIAFQPDTRSLISIKAPTDREMRKFEMLMGKNALERRRLSGASEATQGENDDQAE